MNLISRSIINKDFNLKILDKELEFDRIDIIRLIDRAKTFLIKERQVRPNDKVILTFGDYYIPWFFACAELGLTFIISASHVVKNYKKLNDRYGDIQHLIVPFNKTDLEEFRNTYSDIALDMNLIKDYDEVSESATIWATDNSILTLSISEKYNLKLKNIVPEEHTHDFYYRLMQRNSTVLNLNRDEKCFHLRILHHGSSLGTFFLPTFYSCANHFWCDETDHRWAKYLITYKINRCLIFERMLNSLSILINRNTVDLSFLKLYTLTQPSIAEINNIVVKHNVSITSIFGMTSTSGPIFLQEVTSSNYRTYDRERFYKPLDDFYELNIEDGYLSITFDNKTVKSKDKFKIINDEYYFSY